MKIKRDRSLISELPRSPRGFASKSSTGPSGSDDEKSAWKVGGPQQDRSPTATIVINLSNTCSQSSGQCPFVGIYPQGASDKMAPVTIETVTMVTHDL